MPEDHRRVEARSIVGTGMATDPERLQRIEDEAARRERAWRDAPAEGFGSVLGATPARGQMADATTPDPRRRVEVPAAEVEIEAAPTEASTSTSPARPPPARPARQSPRAPDPRERLLREQLAARTKR